MADFEVNFASLTVPDEMPNCVETPPVDPADCGCPPNVGPGGGPTPTPAAGRGGAGLAAAAAAKVGNRTGGRSGGGSGSGSGPGCPTCSAAPIRYATGEIVLNVSDLETGGFGIPWGQTRSYANRLSNSYNFGNGYNWLVAEWTYLSIQPDPGTVAVMGIPTQTLWFDQVGNDYVPRFSVRQTLQFDPVDYVYRLYDLDGGVTE